MAGAGDGNEPLVESPDPTTDRPSRGMPRIDRANLLRAIGPGIVYAGAAIGVSHLVQSTRAGATYGFGLVGVVLLANVCKYPFFEFAQRYAAGTGESMIAGYRRLGWWALLTFAVISFLSAMPTLAVLVLVTSGLVSQIVNLPLSVLTWSGVLGGVCFAVLAAGGYPWLDRLMKFMMAFLAVCTLATVAAAVVHGSNRAPDFAAPTIFTPVGVAFVIALMGWMPTPVDIAVWPSLWMEARARQTGHRPTLREALFDFNLGYGATVVMALLFLSMGALVLYGTGEDLPDSAPAFAAKLVAMYTQTLGSWARWLVAIAAFTCMFSTTITVMDGYPRVLAACLHEFRPLGERGFRRVYWCSIVLLTGSAWWIIWYFSTRAGKMKALVDFVTILAFLSAPLLALLNWRVMVGRWVPEAVRPPRWLQMLSWVGLAFLLVFSGWFIVVRGRAM